MATLPDGAAWSLGLMEYQLVLGRMDALSRVFCLAFALVTWLGVLFALKVENDWQQVSALVYAGSALGVTLASDWLSLYLFWEIMAVASTFIILSARTKGAREAGLRYIMVHISGGLILLAGIMFHLAEDGQPSPVRPESGFGLLLADLHRGVGQRPQSGPSTPGSPTPIPGPPPPGLSFFPF